MRLTTFLLLAASSLLSAPRATAAVRPHYGGTLQVKMQTAPTSLDPGDSSQGNPLESRNLLSLMFETLVSLDEQGKPQPSLAISWQSEPGNQRWRFLLRSGVTFPDGTSLTSDLVAASLRRTNPTWKVFSEGEAVVIERDVPAPDLPADLTMQRNSIAKRVGGKVLGTGPFAIAQWDPGKKLVLTARDDYWGSRAFLDSIEVEMGKNLREQMISLDLGKAQLIEVAPEQTRRAMAGGRHLESSSPVELIALVFGQRPSSADDERQRQALGLSIDRGLINTVLLQGAGEPTGSLLPNWMTGYGFVFPASMDLEQARQVRSGIPHTTAWTLSYDSADPISRVIAERIVLNARDAGLGIQIATAKSADLQLVRMPLISLDPQIALRDLAVKLGLPQPSSGGVSADDLYGIENRLLQAHRVIPMVHLRTAYGVSNTVKNWRILRDGGWEMPDVWLAADKP